jgi:hypothetical protein
VAIAHTGTGDSQPVTDTGIHAHHADGLEGDATNGRKPEWIADAIKPVSGRMTYI